MLRLPLLLLLSAADAFLMPPPLLRMRCAMLSHAMHGARLMLLRR